MCDYIIKDLTQSITSYLLSGIVIGAIVTAFIYIIFSIQRNKIKGFHIILCFLMITYVVCLVQITFFSREPGSRTGIDLRLFSTWGESAMSRAFVIENIILFLPFGVLVMGFLKGKWAVPACIFLALGASLANELIQLVTKRGHFQVDDILMNVLGAVLGMVIYLIVKFLINNIIKSR